MAVFDSNGVDIAYQVHGEGPPILLIHGFASNGRVNWQATGWVNFLLDNGRQVIVIDNRGHGESEKLYDDTAYDAMEMAEDSRRLLDHLSIDNIDVMGYSMGARITALLTINHPERVRSAVIAGLAQNMVRGFDRGDKIAAALEAENDEEITEAEPKIFRRFAIQTKSDLKALAACMRAPGHIVTMGSLNSIKVPVLVVAGDADAVAGPVQPLVDAIPDAKGLVLSGKDHMKAVGDYHYKQGVLDFYHQLDGSFAKS